MTKTYIQQWGLFSRHGNTGLVSSRVRLTSLGEGVSLTLDGHSSSDGIIRNIPWGRRVITSSSLTPHLFLLDWSKLNLTLLLNQLRLT